MPPGRDLGYLAFAMLGVALALLVSSLFRQLSIRHKNRRTSLALLFLSGSLAAAAGAVVISDAAILLDRQLLLPAGILAAAFMFSVWFPRAVAFPLIIVAGAAVALGSYFFLRLPELRGGTASLAALRVGADGVLGVRFSFLAGPEQEGRFLELPAADPAAPLAVRVVLVRLDRRCPLVGGQVRGAVAMLSRGDAALAPSGMANHPLFGRQAPDPAGRGLRRLGIDIADRTGEFSAAELAGNPRWTISADDQGPRLAP
jgi:hypothetical protein